MNLMKRFWEYVQGFLHNKILVKKCKTKKAALHRLVFNLSYASALLLRYFKFK